MEPGVVRRTAVRGIRAMSPSKSYPFSRRSIEELSWFKGEPSWLTQARLSAWDQYERFRAQNLRLETSLSGLAAFSEPPRRTVPSHEWPADLQQALDERGDEEGLIVQRDSTILSRSITKEQSKKGVLFTDLDTAVKTAPELVRPFFTGMDPQRGAEAALRAAFWSGGTFLYVPAFVDVVLPFHTCYWLSTPGMALFPRTIIVAEKGSSVSLVDEYISGDLQGLSLGALDVSIAERARVSYYNLENWNPRVLHHFDVHSQSAPTGSLLSVFALLRPTPGQVQLTVHHETQGSRSSWQAAGKGLEGDSAVFGKIPMDAMRERIRHYLLCRMAGACSPWTLQRAHEFHPEIRI